MTNKKYFSIFLILASILIVFSFSCSSGDSQPNGQPAVDIIDPTDKSPVDTQIELKIAFTDGEYSSYSKAYVIWIENESEGFIQNVFVCKKVHDYALTGTPLPYWEMNKRTVSDSTEVDAVSGATQKHTDFSVSATLKEEQTVFKLFFEVDHSFDGNDWFTADQPAILYSVDIDLSDPKNEYTLKFIGWTPNEKTENIISSTPAGTFQSETRYITQLKTAGNEYGLWDERTATDMVGSIVVTIMR